MGTIARGFCFIFIIQAAVYQVSSQNQQSIAQYVLSNGPTSGQQNVYPSPNTRPNIPQPSQARSTPLPSTQTPLKPPIVPKPGTTSGPLDSNVLNNLAIALQLLIVSNIMNMPEPESIPNLSKLTSKFDLSSPVLPSLPYSASILEQALSKPLYYETQSKPLYPYEAQSKPFNFYEAQSLAKPNLYYETQSIHKPNLYAYETQTVPKPGMYQTQSVPNANFLGSSGFSDPVFGSVGVARPNPRSSMTLMSPYDALGTSSFSDPLSSFPSSYSKNDFQSPYASILAAEGARDLFSGSDLF